MHTGFSAVGLVAAKVTQHRGNMSHSASAYGTCQSTTRCHVSAERAEKRGDLLSNDGGEWNMDQDCMDGANFGAKSIAWNECVGA
jgi:hypothetical protein